MHSGQALSLSLSLISRASPSLYRGNPGGGIEARPPGSGGLHGAHPDDHDEGQRLHQVHERPPAGHGEGRQTHPHHRGGRR